MHLRATRRTPVVAALVVVCVAAIPAVAGAHGDHAHDQSSQDGGGARDDRTHTERHGDSALAVHDCSGRDEPTPEDEANAEQLIADVTAGIDQYHDPSVAEGDGYRITDEAAQSPSPIDHYMRSSGGGSEGRQELDPARPDGLVYFDDGDGAAVLLGAVWRSRAECPPQPAGPLTVWHDHSPNGCPAAHPECPAETGEADTAHVPKMLHVWIFEGVAEPFAHDLPGALGDGTGHGPDDARRQLPFDDDSVSI